MAERRLGTRVSRWDSLPSVRPVVNTDGEVLRKQEIRPAVFMAGTTRTVFRTGARVEAGRLVGGHKDWSRRDSFAYESGDRAMCLCRVAGSERCPVKGHSKRDIPAPEAWNARTRPDGVRLVKAKVPER